MRERLAVLEGIGQLIEQVLARIDAEITYRRGKAAELGLHNAGLYVRIKVGESQAVEGMVSVACPFIFQTSRRIPTVIRAVGGGYLAAQIKPSGILSHVQAAAH